MITLNFHQEKPLNANRNRALQAVLLLLVFFLGLVLPVKAQTRINAEVLLSPSSRVLTVKQEVIYQNTSNDSLYRLYFNDWNNAFSSKDSPLAHQFTAEYLKKFHYATVDERGQTKLDYIRKPTGEDFTWIRPEGSPDLLEITLDQKLAPQESVHLVLSYTLRIPEDKFTGYGVDQNGNFNLRYWLIVPTVYEEGWHPYNHQNLNAEYSPLIDYKLQLKTPPNYVIYTDLEVEEEEKELHQHLTFLKGEQRQHLRIVFAHQSLVDEVETDGLFVATGILGKKVAFPEKEAAVQRIHNFLKNRLGDYPHSKILLTEADYKTSPIFGLNQLPNFLSPFTPEFAYELKTLKVLTQTYLRNSLLLDLRKEEWVINAIGMYLLMDYIEEYYPEERIIGKMSRWIGLNWSHLAELGFNEQFSFFFMNMNRLNLDQPLSMSKDSLVRFNREIANPYKAGIGLNYVADFTDRETVDKAIKEFFETYRLKPVRAEDFEEVLQKHSNRSLDWFFKDYVQTNKRIDFTIDEVKEVGDSLRIRIKNKENHAMPLSVYGLNKWEVVSKTWVEPDQKFTEIQIPSEGITRVGLNYEGIIPEFNQRDNYKKPNGLLNKPLQFRLFTDVEDPHYTQFFLRPEFAYNLYDGFTLGTGISNLSVLPKNFMYSITPQYGFKSETLVGSLIVANRHQYRNRNLSSLVYGLTGNRFSYSYDLYYHRLSPFVRLNWRHRDLRNRERQSVSLRNVMVRRDPSPLINQSDRPNYSVLNLHYTYSNRNLVNSVYSATDYQLGKNFSKVSFTAKYRQLFLDNRQLEFRLFAGAFLYNNTESDYFSFALDRPSDYLFDYNYYGRSEGSGFFSQQFIEAEGGFKSQIDPGFANSWMASFNSSTSLFKDWVYFYGDFGILKNRGKATKVRYDSGLRLSLVQDYFEVFFPVYSSLGWEVGQSDYDKKIRFIITLDFQTLMGLFERTYY